MRLTRSCRSWYCVAIVRISHSRIALFYVSHRLKSGSVLKNSPCSLPTRMPYSGVYTVNLIGCLISYSGFWWYKYLDGLSGCLEYLCWCLESPSAGLTPFLGVETACLGTENVGLDAIRICHCTQTVCLDCLYSCLNCIVLLSRKLVWLFHQFPCLKSRCSPIGSRWSCLLLLATALGTYRSQYALLILSASFSSRNNLKVYSKKKLLTSLPIQNCLQLVNSCSYPTNFIPNLPVRWNS